MSLNFKPWSNVVGFQPARMKQNHVTAFDNNTPPLEAGSDVLEEVEEFKQLQNVIYLE